MRSKVLEAGLLTVVITVVITVTVTVVAVNVGRARTLDPVISTWYTVFWTIGRVEGTQ